MVLTYTGKRLILDRAIPNKDEIVQSFDGSLLLNDFRRSESADHFHNTSNFNNSGNSNHDFTNLDQFAPPHLARGSGIWRPIGFRLGLEGSRIASIP